MKLHEYQYEFKDLISIVASKLHIPESAVERDYYIVLLLKNLENSEYADKCVFKGGTSLSKCYPGSIERFSEDIDLTFLGMELSDKACDKSIKQIEAIMTTGAQSDKITAERSNRSKSMYVWFANEDNKIKLEIGSSVRPDPYSKKTFKSYIHEFLEEQGAEDDIQKFELASVTLNVLHIERTFIDKIMSVKRHAICESLDKKVRHIYDVTRLFTLPEIQDFLRDKTELKRLINYGDKIKVLGEELNFLKRHKDFVVLECVDRLLLKGYKPIDIVLDGRVSCPDIVLNGNVEIYCEQWGKDYLSATKTFNPDKNNSILYTSRLVSGLLEYKNIIKVDNEIYNYGLFEPNVPLYSIIPQKAKEVVIEQTADIDNYEIFEDELITYTGKSKIVKVPEGITTIGASAFWNNTSVEEIILP